MVCVSYMEDRKIINICCKGSVEREEESHIAQAQLVPLEPT